MVNPLSLNLYTYCYNNPLIYIDPSGHYVVCDWLNNINDKYIGGPLNDLNDQYIGGPLNQAADGDWEGVVNTGEGIVKFVLFDWDDPNAVDIIGIAFKPAKGVKPAGKIISKGAGKVDLNVRPVASNQKLNNIIGNLYKGQNNPNKIGNGTTMDAIRNEIQTGMATGGKFHTTKGQESINALNNLLKSGNLSTEDANIAKALINDLSNALAGK